MPLYLDVLSLFKEAISSYSIQDDNLRVDEKVAFYEGFVVEILKMYGF